MRSSFLLLGMLISLPIADSVRATDKEPSTAKLGTKIPNLTFHDEAGKAFSLYDIKDRKAIVIVFLSFDCPVSTSYSDPLATIQKQHGNHVSFIGLTINDDESRAQVAKLARDYKISFPVYKDEKLTAANALKADMTPECFVLDSEFVLRYRGRIDNSYLERLKKNPQVTQQDLQQALGELLSGRPIKTPATLPIGCMIVREAKALPKVGDVTYHRDVAPILQNRCQQCHRPGEVGPFSLLTYKQAVNWADDIKSYTQKRLMPPWKIAEGVDFHNDRRMSDKEIATLAAWVDGNCPEGDPKHAPPAKVFSEGWQLGTPDLILTVSDDFQLGPTGKDLFRCFALPTHLAEDTYVTGVEIRPGNPRVVHHVLLFIDPQGKGRNLEQEQKKKDGQPVADNDPHRTAAGDSGPGYSVSMGVGFTPVGGGMGGWAPGQIGRYLPDGTGYLLPKNSDVILQVHYHRNGRAEKDRTQIGLYFAKKKVDRPFQAAALAGQGALGMFFSIPAGAERHHLQGDMWAAEDFTMHTISPHMHMIGKEIAVTMTPPDGPARTLFAIKEWDYNWQETYIFKEPVQVKAGTRFHIDAYYDNSDKNPHNPSSPPKAVTFGEQTFNEMCFVFLGGTSNRAGRGLPMSRVALKKE
jgi:peroxiredoxin